MQLTVENLKLVGIDLLETAEGAHEVRFLTELSITPKPCHRDDLIRIRDQALNQAAFDWAVLLSHFIDAMACDDFWNGHTITPSTL